MRKSRNVQRVRKVIRLGGSLVLSLPPEWLADIGITQEHYLKVTSSGDLVIIRPHERAETDVSA